MAKTRKLRGVASVVANYIFAIMLVGSTFYFGYLGKPDIMLVMVLAFAVAGAFLNLEKFKWFRGAGFEAELAATVDEAYATKEELERLVAESESTTEELKREIETAKEEAKQFAMAIGR